jgi:hypothetical protein
MTEIVLEFIEIDGARAVLTPLARVRSAHTRNMRDAAEIRRRAEALEASSKMEKYSEDERKAKAEESAFLTKEADRIQEAANMFLERSEALRQDLGDKISEKRYPFRQYSDGEKQDALIECTTYESGEPRFNEARFRRLLTAAACGMSETELRGLPANEAEALILEALERSEPDPARMDFLS